VKPAQIERANLRRIVFSKIHAKTGDPLRRENEAKEMFEGAEIKRRQSGAPTKRTMLQKAVPLDYPIHEAKLCDDCGLIAANLDPLCERARDDLQHIEAQTKPLG